MKNWWNCDVWTITFHVNHILWFLHGYKIEIFLKNSWNCNVRLNFFTKICLTNNYFSRDPHYVILAQLQSWNIFEKLMKVCSPPEFFHKNMSHEQLLIAYQNTNLLTLIYYWIWFFLSKGWWYLRTRWNI